MDGNDNKSPRSNQCSNLTTNRKRPQSGATTTVTATCRSGHPKDSGGGVTRDVSNVKFMIVPSFLVYKFLVNPR